MPRNTHWTESETLAAFWLYSVTPRHRWNEQTPDIRVLAEHLDRTPAAVLMKLHNLASRDPARLAIGRKGLGHASELDAKIWKRLEQDHPNTVLSAERAWLELTGQTPTESEHTTEPRSLAAVASDSTLNTFFRRAVLACYEERCILTGLAIPELLVATHIITPASDPQRVGDPQNGLCLNPLHHQAFAKGFLALDANWTILVTPALSLDGVGGGLANQLGGLAGRKAEMPERFEPDREALRWHREHVFRAKAAKSECPD
ncbi:MAG: HNH endonuclease [Phycisphaerales bacterium]